MKRGPCHLPIPLIGSQMIFKDWSVWPGQQLLLPHSELGAWDDLASTLRVFQTPISVQTHLGHSEICSHTATGLSQVVTLLPFFSPQPCQVPGSEVHTSV